MFKWETKGSRFVIERLFEAGYEAVYVGGALRDIALGLTPKDIDIATAATPEEIEALFHRTIDVGKEHGTIIVLVGEEQLEVTTYRSESTYSDHRRPDDVTFVRSLHEDLKRRDFTMNAMAIDHRGQWIDPFDGLRHIQERTIQAVGQADERFEEDALRMIRAVRFVSTLGFTVESETQRAMQKHASLISYLAMERIKQEFDKMFRGEHLVQALHLLYETGLHRYLPASQEELPLQPFSLVQQPIEGWVLWAKYHHLTSADVAKAYKLSKKEREAIERYLTLAQEREWTLWTVYHYSLEELLFIRRLNERPETEQQLRQMKAQLPIQSKRDLAFDGKDVKRYYPNCLGENIGQLLTEIERAVVLRKVSNDTEEIIEWVNEHVYERLCTK
ncbi:CCA tRNA nucleotidyltransferase [Savagea faecisuis]|uniref:CCA tRNA nucleotidyltransferase n=1 Tax=Savagea faecisuis TaxID=1274803 RepID=A0ABW3GWF9_9BACL